MYLVYIIFLPHTRRLEHKHERVDSPLQGQHSILLWFCPHMWTMFLGLHQEKNWGAWQLVHLHLEDHPHEICGPQCIILQIYLQLEMMMKSILRPKDIVHCCFWHSINAKYVISFSNPKTFSLFFYWMHDLEKNSKLFFY